MSDMKGIEISDLLGLSEPLTKLVETVTRGIGALYKPLHIKRMANAKAEETRIISEVVEDRINLPIAYKYGNVEIDSTDMDGLMHRMQSRMLYEEQKRQLNIETVVSHAYTQLENEQSTDSKPVDEDWVTRFFNIAKDISSEDMQQIWGKILAGEIVKPGSFSMRTLDTIRNISQEEAAAFQKVVPCISRAGNSRIFTSEIEIYNKYGISYSDILLLDECGLMTSSVALSITQKCDEEDSLVMFTENNVLFAKGISDNPVEIRYGVHKLTSAGIELYRILSYIPNEDYFYDFAEYIFKRNKNVNFRIHKVNQITEAAIDYDDVATRIYKANNGVVQSSS